MPQFNVIFDKEKAHFLVSCTLRTHGTSLTNVQSLACISCSWGQPRKICRVQKFGRTCSRFFVISAIYGLILVLGLTTDFYI